MVTHEKLKQILNYNPSTGVFTWKINASASARVGDVAGTIDNKGYRRVGFSRKYRRAHRLAWFYVYGVWPEDQIDHINRDRDDNRIENLRSVNSQQNSRNRSPEINRLGVIGVSWCNKSGKFHSRISIDRKNKPLGYFSGFFDAVCARKSAENRYFKQ